MAEICQNRIAGKDQFFRPPSVAQIEKCKTNESQIKPEEYAHKFAAQNDAFTESTDFFREQYKICSQDNNSPNLTFSRQRLSLA